VLFITVYGFSVAYVLLCIAIGIWIVYFKCYCCVWF